MSNCIIYLIGFSGSGKFTIAKELCKAIYAVQVSNTVFNDLIFNFVNLQNSIVPDDVWEQIFEVRKNVVRVLEKYYIKSKHYIFTNELLEGDTYDQRVYNLAVNLSKKINTQIFPVVLHCSHDELIKRIKLKSARNKNRNLVTDPNFTIKRIQEKKLLIPKDAFEIDNSTLSVKETVSKIIEEVKNRKLTVAFIDKA
ncbi:MAG: AAA family ATPase [Wolbachia endosymbiont of Tyrophagus putrescentiae]|nr:AAA family ATPase [Wolbachia endosymbiont of Tyrophagus putrescentiae]